MIFYRFAAKKTKGIENGNELQNLIFEPGDGPLQMSGAANGVLSSGKDLCHVDASDLRVFATKIIRLVWNTPSFSRDSKTKGLPHSFYCYLFFNRLFLLLVSVSRSGTMPKYFMIANICNFLRVFHTFLYKIGGHVYRHFAVKPRAYCRLVTGIVGDVTGKINKLL